MNEHTQGNPYIVDVKMFYGCRENDPKITKFVPVKLEDEKSGITQSIIEIVVSNGRGTVTHFHETLKGFAINAGLNRAIVICSESGGIQAKPFNLDEFSVQVKYNLTTSPFVDNRS